MDFGKLPERMIGMNDAVWQRHANPISGWSRMPVIPLLALAIWSRVWIGWWSLLPIGVTIFWIWLNPRAFPIPKSTNNWMSKGVLGERVWLNRKLIPIPQHHARAATILSAISGIGIIPFVLGLVQLDVWATAAGVAIIMLSKLWFLDRMVWLFDDINESHEEYRNWLRYRMNNEFEISVRSQIALLNAGKPLEVFDAYFSADGVMFSNSVMFAKGAPEAREKQEPFISAAASISGLITDLKTHAPTQTCVFRNKSSFRTHDEQVHRIDGLCWQQWKQGRIVVERYYDGDAILAVIDAGVMLNPQLLIQNDTSC